MNPADLTVTEASAALARRDLSSAELVEACLARIAERDGTHSFDGDPSSINAWVRVYADGAHAAAARADERLAAGGAPPLCGIPVGLKDLYAVAGRPLTASSRVLDEMPERDSTVWARLAAEGMVLLGHLHTHEFAAGGTTDQVGNPWALDRSAGGSSGGSAAAVAARMTPAATGTDTAGSLRIPSALCGTSTIKPTHGTIPLDGVVPLSWSLDHAGPIARTVDDCALLLAGMTGGGRPEGTLRGARIGVSSRVGDLAAEVAAGFDATLDALERLGAEVVDGPPAPNVMNEHFGVLLADMLGWHRRFDDKRDLYRPSTRGFLEAAQGQALLASDYAALLASRPLLAAEWDVRLDALVEPTVPVVAPLRGTGYDAPFNDSDLVSLTHHWNWLGYPVVALPAPSHGLPVGVSLVGPTGSDWRLLALASELQAELGVPAPPL